MDGCVHPAAARRVTSSCGDFTLDGVKFRVVCRGNLEIGLESDTQVGIDNISFRIKTIYIYIIFSSHMCIVIPPNKVAFRGIFWPLT